MRQSLANIYQSLINDNDHKAYIKTHFPMLNPLTIGMQENSKTYKKLYPDTFARFFFRFVKAISNRKGTGLRLN